MPELILYPAICLLAGLISYYVCQLSRKWRVLDMPDGQRKFQTAPVPRLGGAGILAGFFAVILLAGILHAVNPVWLGNDFLPGGVGAVAVALAASLGFAAIGAADDVSDLNAVLKLVLLLAVCIGAPLLGVAVPALDSPFGDLTTPALMIAGSALWLLVFTNAANFMDGSNGLAIGVLAFMFAGLGASLLLGEAGRFPPGLIAIIAASAGFLIINMRGQIYAGDIGAFGVSALFATLAIISGLSVWTIATLALPILIDTLMTLVLRAKRGESLFTAHRDHAYQALIKTGWSAWEVAILWWGLASACAAGASIGAAGGGALPFALFICLAIPLTVGWVTVQRSCGQMGTRLVQV